MLGISAVAGHFQQNWTHTPISWEYFNVKDESILTNDPSVPIIAAPFIELLTVKSMTIPIEQTTKRCLYCLHVVFSLSEGSGMFSYWKALTELQKIYENRTIPVDGLVVAFQEVENSISSSRGGRSLQQASIRFFTYENLDLME
jgi:hypothetical protein